jgi:hypothetical protein
VDSAGVRADTVETEYFAEALGLVQRTKRIQGPGVDLLDSLVLHRISFRWPFPLPQAPAPPEGDVADLFPFDSTRWRIYRKVDHVRGDTTAWAARWGKVREENGQPVWREWRHELASVDDEPTEAGQPVGTDWAYAGERVMRRPVGDAHWSAWLWFQPLPHNMQGQYWIQTPWIPTYSLEEFLRVEETGHGGQAYHVTYHWQEEYRGIWVKDQAHRYEPGIGLVHQTVEESGSGRRWDLEVWWIRNTPWLRSSGP